MSKSSLPPVNFSVSESSPSDSSDLCIPNPFSPSSDSSDPCISNPFSPPFLTAYGPKQRNRMFFNPDTDRTKQSFKDECDINVIMRRYAATGQVDHLNQRSPMYGEIPATDFMAAMQLVVEAKHQFDALPSAVRDRFANDPARLLAFLENPENRAEGEKLGLIVPKPVPPQAVEKPEENKA